MPPTMNKLAKQDSKSKGKKEPVTCPYCGFHLCWKHGRYTRKGFHRLHAGHKAILREVLRYLCRSPACKHTFSLLPEDVLPYCRFFLSGWLGIASDLSAGKSVYRIAKYWDLSLRVIRRAVDRIKEVTAWLEALFREVTGSMAHGFHGLIKALCNRFAWSRFTRYVYHRLYPLRAGHILNPHNSGIKRL